MEPKSLITLTKPSKTSFLIKFAVSTLSIDSLPKWIYIITYIYSQIQILSVFTKTALTSSPKAVGWITDTFQLIDQVCSFGDSWNVDQNPSLTFSVLAIICLFFLSEIGSVIYLLCGDWINRKSFAFVIKYWATSSHLLLRILFYPIHFIGTKVLSDIFKAENKTLLFSETTYLVIKILIIAGLIWNFIYTAVIFVILSPKIKNKNLISTHTCLIDSADLILKTIFPILWFFGYENIKDSVILPALCFTYSVYRDWTLFWFLPYYDISLLKLATKLQAFLTIFAFSIMVPKVIEDRSTADNNFTLSLVITIIIGPIFISIYAKYLEHIMLKILLNPSKMKPYYLLHYWDIWKYISSRSKIPTRRVHKAYEKHLYISLIIQTLKTQGVLPTGGSISDNKFATLVRQHIFEAYLELLRTRMRKGSGKQILRACLARHYSKSENLYLMADELVSEGLKLGLSIELKTSFYLIRAKMFNKINNLEQSSGENEENGSRALNSSDIQKYIRLSYRYEDFKQKIAEELKLQVDFWKNYQTQEPDCRIIFDLPQDIRTKAKQVRKRWIYLSKQMGPEFAQPLLIYGFYLSFVRNELVSGDHLLREYQRRELRKEELNEEMEDKTSIHSLFNSICLTISGSSNSFGRILDCSNNIEKYLGFSRGFILGQNITLIIPSIVSENFRKHANSNHMEINILNTKREMYALDKEGYFVPCWIYITLRFLPNYELSYSVLLSPKIATDRVVLVQENGKVVNCSMNFAQDLGFDSQTKANLNIFLICPELKEFIKAFMKPNNLPKNSSHKTLTNDTDHFHPESEVIGEDNKSSLRTVTQSAKFSLFAKKYIGFDSRVKLGENTFTFYYPSKVRLPFINNQPIIVVYTVKVQNSSHEDEKLFHLTLKKVSADNPDTMKNQYSCDSSFENSFQNHLHHHNKLGFVSQSSKRIVTEEISSNPAPIKTEMSGLSRFNKYSSLYKKPLGQITVGSTIPDHEDENIKSLNITTMRTETNVLCSPANKRSRRKEINYLEAVKLNQGDLDSPSEEPVQLETPKKHFLNAERKSKRQKEQERSYISIEEAVKELIQDRRDPHEQGKEVKLYEEIQKILEEKTHKKPVINYVVLFILTMVVQLVFLIWLNQKVVEASRESANLSKALQAAFLRTYWVNLANQEARYWVAIRGDLFHSWDIIDETIVMNRTFIRLNNEHSELISSIRYLRPELQLIFFEKNVRIYERNEENNLSFLALDDNFQAVSRIIERGLTNSYQIPEDQTPLVDFIDENNRFIFDNSFDDLLVVSERLIEVLETEIFSILTRARLDFQIFLIVCTSLLGTLIVYSISFLVRMNKDTGNFIKLFLSLPNTEANRIETTASKFYSIIKAESDKQDIPYRRDPAKHSLGANSNELVSNSFGNVNRLPRKTVSRDSMRRLRLRNWISAMEMFIALLVILGFMGIYYLKALDQITVIEKYQTNINSSLENIKLASLISAQIHSMVVDNATTTVRHQPVIDGLLKDIDNIKKMNEFQQRLTDENGGLAARQQEILFNMSCDEAFTPDYTLSEGYAVETCHALSKGSGRLGLFNILSEFSTNIPEYVLKFESSERTLGDIGLLYDEFPNLCGNLFDVSMSFFFKSVHSTIDEFQALKDKLESQRVLLGWIAVFVLLSLVVILWLFIIRKLVQRVFEPQDVLRLVPPRLICKNSFLKKYVYNIRR